MCKVGQTGVPMVDIPCFVGIDVAKDLRARPGGPTLKKIPGTLDNQDSCSARTSLCAVKVAWKNVVTPRVYRYPPLGLCRRPLVLPCRPPDTPRIPHRVSHSGGTTGAPLGVPCSSVRLPGSPAGMLCLGCVSAYWEFLPAPTGPRIADCLADIYSASLAGSRDHAGV